MTGQDRDLATLDDGVLATRAGEGDRAAMEVLLERHFDFVHAVCRRIVDDPQLAEDARQETLFRAARRIRSYNHESAFKTWLFSIARNTSLNLVRAHHPRAELDPDRGARPSTSGRAQERAVDDRMEIDAALERLAGERRDVIVLRYLCDLPYNEIAEVLDVELNTVRTRLWRGLADMRKLLKSPAWASGA